MREAQIALGILCFTLNASGSVVYFPIDLISSFEWDDEIL